MKLIISRNHLGCTSPPADKRFNEFEIDDYIQEIDMELGKEGTVFIGRITSFIHTFKDGIYDINYEVIFAQDETFDDGREVVTANRCKVYKLTKEEMEDAVMTWRI